MQNIDWNKPLKSRTVRYILITSAILVIVLIAFGIFTPRINKIGPVEFNNAPNKVQDTNNSTNIGNMQGDIVKDHATKNVYNNQKVVVYNYINDKNKNAILLLSKYIDTHKTITIRTGNNDMPVEFWQFKYEGFTAISWNEGDLINFRVNDKDQLLISTSIHKMDGTLVAKVIENKLIPIPPNYRAYASEKYIEIFDDHDLPVLQIDLDKDNNTIIISGLFFSKDQCVILSKTAGATNINYPKSYLLLSHEERDVLLNKILTIAEKGLKPLHEE